MSSTILITLAVFCLMGAGCFSLYYALYGSHRALEERFADLAVKIRASQGVFDEGAQEDASFSRTLFKWASSHVPAPRSDTPSGEKLQQTLTQAGYSGSASPHTFQVFRVLFMAGLAFVGVLYGVFAGKAPGAVMIYGLVGAGVGFMGPLMYIQRSARSRQFAIARQLSDILDLLVVCVEAGLGLYEAIKIVGTESERQKQEIGRELALVAAEISAGASLGQALRNLAERTAVEDIKPLAATLIQSEQLGAQIAPALHASSDALRTRRRLRAEEAAQKTTIKILFPLVLFVLPAMLLVIVGPAVVQVIRTLGK
jgi:tight adherence protein C